MMLRRRKKKRIRNPFKPVYQTGRERRRAEYRVERPKTREAAWEHDGGRCVFPTCRRFVTLAAAHIHEVIFRSRGGSAIDVNNTVTTCGECHGHVHGRVGGALKRIERTEAGGLRFFERITGKSPWIEVGV